jgi:hypothetical protein
MILDQNSNEAIREEIGERLRALLSRHEMPLPPRLSELMLRLRKLDEADSPSIVPASSEAAPNGWLHKWRVFRSS